MHAAAVSVRNGSNTVKAGTWYAVGAYAIWGLVPLYWKALASVPEITLTATLK